jgi:hypothetical protein
MFSRRDFGIRAGLAALGITMGNTLPPPPDRPGLGNTFKRPITSLLAGSIATGAIDIGTDVPAELVAFYASAGITTSRAWIGQIVDANNYGYFISGSNGSEAIYARGLVRNGQVKELDIMDWNTLLGCLTQGFGASNQHVELDFYDAVLEFGKGSPPPATADIRWGGTPLPKGLVYSETFTFAFTSPAAVGEVLAWTSGQTMFLPNGHAFKVVWKAQRKSATAQVCGINLRQTNLAGTLLRSGGTDEINFTGRDIETTKIWHFINTSGVDKTLKLAVTVNPTVAAAVTLESGAGAGIGYIAVTDEGPATLIVSNPVYAGYVSVT